MALVGAFLVVATSAAADAIRSMNPADNPAIIGGTNAPPGKWPFQVALLDMNWGGSNLDSERCGGTLVDEFHVITAAHCVDGYQPNELRVLTGTQSLAKGGTRRQIARIKMHPSYNPNRTDYDIAVITLKTPATDTAFFATLITPAQELALSKPGMTSIVVGWGSTIRDSGGYPELLQQVAVPIVKRTDCNDSNSYDGAITARMICAGYAKIKRDSCDGDSGGPLVVKDAAGRWRLQAGIVSWGAYPCAAPNQPGVYARVAVLSAWARNVMSGDGSLIAALNCERLSGQGQQLCLQTRMRDAR
jgi:secreted trypsin-like serine protease